MAMKQASTARLVAHVCTATASTVEVQELCHQRAVQLLEEPIMVNDMGMDQYLSIPFLGG